LKRFLLINRYTIIKFHHQTFKFLIRNVNLLVIYMVEILAFIFLKLLKRNKLEKRKKIADSSQLIVSLCRKKIIRYHNSQSWQRFNKYKSQFSDIWTLYSHKCTKQQLDQPNNNKCTILQFKGLKHFNNSNNKIRLWSLVRNLHTLDILEYQVENTLRKTSKIQIISRNWKIAY